MGWFVKTSTAFPQSTKETTRSRNEIRLVWKGLFLAKSWPGNYWINSMSLRICSSILSLIGLCRQDSNWALPPFMKTSAVHRLSSPSPGLKCSLSLTKKPPPPFLSIKKGVIQAESTRKTNMMLSEHIVMPSSLLGIYCIFSVLCSCCSLYYCLITSSWTLSISGL